MERDLRDGSTPFSGTILISYRGVEQLVARRAHNPEAVWFKSHPRNQNEKDTQTGVFFVLTEMDLGWGLNYATAGRMKRARGGGA